MSFQKYYLEEDSEQNKPQTEVTDVMRVEETLSIFTRFMN